ncbi:putative surface antigen [Trypanosoma theileri]|uniref:Putative surface antigen n=1 Tax=Trypanosoma theileri TaxID=67003 RepID=A0A1X0ND37_9TRYP|nr:putative surface antigen [Trypanosoma theileri]ORC78967.1 putative surface antigen [Trypanosoma theileri]
MARLSGLRQMLWCIILCTVFLGTGGAKNSSTLQFLMLFAREFHLYEWSGDNYCTWRGITCSDDNVWVNLSHSNLSGEIPDLLENYRGNRVISVDLSFNPSVRGCIKESWRKLVLVQFINLSHTSLSGTIPSSWKDLHELVELDVSHTNLTTLPDWPIVKLPRCRRLNFAGNNISGKLPASWGSLPSSSVLQELDLRGNRFCDCMPTTWNLPVLRVAARRSSPLLVVPLCNETNSCSKTYDGLHRDFGTFLFLRALAVALSLEWEGREYCKWEGVICPEHSNEGIRVDLSFRELVGELPSLYDVRAPVLVDSLILSGNKNIRGRFPEFWGEKLSLLREIDLSGTSLYGEIPDEWRRMEYIEKIRVSNIMACQGLPRWNGKTLHHLREVDFSYNGFRGTLQDEWSSLNLQSLNITGNSFCGCIPSSWKDVELLNSAAVIANPQLLYKNCSVSNACGNVNSRCFVDNGGEKLNQDDTLQFLKTLKHSLRGDFQESWGGMNYCGSNWKGVRCNNNSSVLEVRLNLSGSSLNGTLPEVSPYINGARVAIVSIDLSNNSGITGLFPSTWGTLTQLRVIDLGETNIYGPIPWQWRTLRNLEEIYVKRTLACLGLPSWDEKNMPNLRRVDFSSNVLHGYLSSSWGSFTKLTYFNISKNRFCGCIPSTWKSSVLREAAILANPALDDENCETVNICRSPNMRCYLGPEGSPTTPDPTTLALAKISKSFGGIITWDGDNYCKNSGGITCGSYENTDGSILNLSQMGLIGTLPELDGISHGSISLSSIDLSNNIGITGTLPASWSGLIHLRSLNLSNTSIKSTVPNKWEELKSLEYLSISRASLYGSLPIWDGAKLVKVKRIDFSSNNFSGVLNDSWFSFAGSNLEYLDISENNNLCVSRRSFWMRSALLLDSLFRASLDVKENCLIFENGSSNQSDGSVHVQTRYTLAMIVTIQFAIISTLF